MKIKINYQDKTETIKKAFNDSFPFLKIEFFNKPHQSGEGSSKISMSANVTRIEQLNPLFKQCMLTIKPNDAVSKIEKDFELAGLHVQVFRKQKEVWIETTKTDNLSLMEQNEMGEKASSPVPGEAIGDRYLEDGQY